MKRINKPTIGRVEKVHFPEFDLENVDVKIDTGAYSSALHCNSIELVKGNQGKILQIKALDPLHNGYKDLHIKISNFTSTIIKNSMGICEERFKITTIIVLGNREIETEFTLTNRSDMKYPVLLGRQALKDNFIVDVSRKYLI